MCSIKNGVLKNFAKSTGKQLFETNLQNARALEFWIHSNLLKKAEMIAQIPCCLILNERL